MGAQRSTDAATFELVWVTRRPAAAAHQRQPVPDGNPGSDKVDAYIARLRALDQEATEGIVDRILTRRDERLSEAEPQVRATMQRVARRVADLPLG